MGGTDSHLLSWVGVGGGGGVCVKVLVPFKDILSIGPVDTH